MASGFGLPTVYENHLRDCNIMRFFSGREMHHTHVFTDTDAKRCELLY